jgi:hypothetical protein
MCLSNVPQSLSVYFMRGCLQFYDWAVILGRRGL